MPTDTKNTRYIEAVGRRKNAVARVRITPAGKGSFAINEGKNLDTYFGTDAHRRKVLEPLEKIKAASKFAVSVKVQGGGMVGQAEAIRHGLARALVEVDPMLRTKLKKAQLLKRDPRVKERRKFGLKKARKAPQWSKR
jgi:small subunit ribosomal protein S9